MGRRPLGQCQGQCGFDKGRSLYAQQNVKNLVTPCVVRLDRNTDFNVRLFIDLILSHIRQGSTANEIHNHWIHPSLLRDFTAGYYGK